MEGLYDAFCQRFTRVLRELQAPDDADIDPALDFAIRAAGFQAGCRAALEADGGSHAG